MIRNFANKTAQDVYDGINSPYARRLPLELHAKAMRLLDQINAAISLQVLRIPPGNRLEKLTGDLQGFLSLRINDRFRIIFRWDGNDAFDVKIIDYR
ncbi:MAG: type II toxin-antitoxin system RelE/ParE family toxin [Candidatus Aminicenantaceae bacterium]